MKRTFLSVMMAMLLCTVWFPFIANHAFAMTEQWESEPNDYVQQADVIQMGPEVVIRGNCHNDVNGNNEHLGESVDFYKFTLVNGSILNVKAKTGWNHLGEYNEDMWLDGTIYKENDLEMDIQEFSTEYDNHFGYSKDEVTWYLSAGTYILEVEYSDDNSGEEYEIEIALEEWENFEEPNNYISQATPLVLNETYCGLTAAESCDESDLDFFKLEVPEKGSYYVNFNRITATDEDEWMDISILDETGVEKDVWNSGDGYYKDYISAEVGETIQEIISLKKGIYYIKIESNTFDKYLFSVVKQLPSAKNIKAKLYGHDDISVSWDAVSGAEGYRVYYRKSNVYDKLFFWKDTTETSLKLANCTDGIAYDFRIVPYKTVGDVVYDGVRASSESVWTLKKLDKPTAEAAAGANIKLSWKDRIGEDGYQVVRSTKADGSYTAVKNVGRDVKNVQLKTVWNKPYYYKVRAYAVVGDKTYYGPWSDAVKCKRNLAAPAKMSTTLYGYDDVKISWSKVSGASGYYVYYKKSTSSEYAPLTRTTATSAKAANLTDGIKYNFKVVPYYKSGDSRYQSAKYKTSSLYTLKEMKTPKVSKSGTKVKVSWDKISGATGYQVAQYQKKSGKYVKLDGCYTKDASKLFTAAKGKTRYYRVRAYKIVDGEKIFGPWSDMKSYKR